MTTVNGRYFIQDKRQYVGNCMLFWQEGGGYTTHVDRAEIFAAEDADRIHKNRRTDIPRKVEDVRAAMTQQVDIQLFVETKTPKEPK